MAILRIEEIRSMSDEELRKKLQELRAELMKEKAVKASGGAVSNPGRMREIRRTIARILTVLNERRRGR